jgi:cytochrome b561
MSFRNSTSSFGSVAKFFHWLISPLIILMLAFGFFMGDFPENAQGLIYGTHKLIGLTILFLMLLRLSWALVNPKPELPADTKAWQLLAERMVHFLLYMFALLMPLVGWIGSVAGGKPPRLGSIEFNLPIAPNKALAGAAFEMHETIAFILIALIVVHVGAALYHHVVKKDNILIRMLPNRRG